MFTKLKLTKSQIKNVKKFLIKKEKSDFLGKIELKNFSKRDLQRLFYEKRGRDLIIEFYHQYTKYQLKKEKGNPKRLCIVGQITFHPIKTTTKEFHLYDNWSNFSKKYFNYKRFNINILE